MPAVAPRRPTAPGPSQGLDVQVAPAPFRWTRARYDRMVEAGVLGPGDKVELLSGQIIDQTFQNEPHAVATGLIADALREAFGTEAHVRDEKPIGLSDDSEPEPDVVVVPGNRRDYLERHPAPSDVLLLVEVAETSLRRDRVWKAALYAEAGVAEYWIVNLPDRVLEVHRDPVGGAYGTKTTLTPGETIEPVHAPDASVAVADLLP